MKFFFIFFIIQLDMVVMHYLPIVDLTELTQGLNTSSHHDRHNEQLFRRKGRAMGRALTTYGFLYLTGHGIDAGLITDSFRVSKDFFIDGANVGVHKQYRRRKGVLLGYIDGDNERDVHDRPPDLKQAYDFVVDSPQFDAIPKPVKKVLSDLWCSFRTTSEMILKLIAASRDDANDDYFSLAHKHVGDIEENTSTMRISYYPSVMHPVETNQSRASEHSDFGTFTMLLQDDVGGLEIIAPDGSFKEVKPISNSIVLNVGDLLQVWSNNHFQSTVHRVVAKQPLSSARQSIVFFTNPDNNYVIDSLDGRKSVGDHIHDRNNFAFEEKEAEE